MPTIDAINQTLNDPSTSNWLKQALKTALQRDCVDAANDASHLSALLTARAKEALKIRVISACEGSAK